MSYTDSTTGQPIEGKAYILKSTDGDEVVDPARLFEGQDLKALALRVYALETALGMAPAITEPDPIGEIPAPAES